VNRREKSQCLSKGLGYGAPDKKTSPGMYGMLLNMVTWLVFAQF